MITIDDCADSTLRISTDAQFNKDNVGLLKDLIKYMYEVRLENAVLADAQSPEEGEV